MPIEYPQTRTRSNTSDSYPSLDSSSSSDYDSDEEAAMIQEEWEENLKQFETVFSILVIPFFGRWYGRRFGYWRELLSSALAPHVHAGGNHRALLFYPANSSLLAVSDSRLDKSILWIDVNHMYHYAPVSTLSCSIPSPFVQHTSPSSKLCSIHRHRPK